MQPLTHVGHTPRSPSGAVIPSILLLQIPASPYSSSDPTTLVQRQGVKGHIIGTSSLLAIQV